MFDGQAMPRVCAKIVQRIDQIPPRGIQRIVGVVCDTTPLSLYCGHNFNLEADQQTFREKPE